MIEMRSYRENSPECTDVCLLNSWYMELESTTKLEIFNATTHPAQARGREERLKQAGGH